MKRMDLMAVLAVAMLPVLFAGCESAHAMSGPSVGPHPFASTERLEDAVSRHANAAEDVAVTLEKMQGELASLTDEMKIVAGQQCDILNAVGELKPVRSAGENPNVPLIDPSQVDTGGSEVATITDASGQSWNLDQFIRDNYKRPWTHPGDIDTELAKHGVNLVGGDLDNATKEKLHAAIHEKELAAVEPTPIAGVSSASDCPDGKCPLRSRSVTVTNQNGTRSSSNVVYPQAQTVTRSYSYSGTTAAAQRKAARQARRCSGGICR